MQDVPLFRELESRIEALGYELVDLERAGTLRRPVLRIRIDRPDSAPGAGVTLEDCVRVSRSLETHLDQREGLSERYVLEVSSPGVERPLVRRRDWERFRGQEVVVRGRGPLVGDAARLQGVLVGFEADGGDEPGDERVRLRLPSGEEVVVRLSEVKSANLVFRWGE